MLPPSHVPPTQRNNWTLDQFLVILDRMFQLGPHHLDAHLRPQALLCQLQSFPYDFIGEVCWQQRGSDVRLLIVGDSCGAFPPFQLQNATDMVPHTVKRFLSPHTHRLVCSSGKRAREDGVSDAVCGGRSGEHQALPRKRANTVSVLESDGGHVRASLCHGPPCLEVWRGAMGLP